MTSQLTVLVVDDSPVDRTLLSAFVNRMGHRAVTAESGEEAICAVAQEPPDLVLMDVTMPGMGGLRAAARLQELSGTRWLPVVLVTADDRAEAFARGLAAGGDYYLTKPVHFASLQAQVLAIQRALRLQSEIEAKNRELEGYRLATEREKEMASGLMQKIVNAHLLDDPALHWWLAPAEHFSGDLIAAARNPRGILHLILADGTGHGLAAAINVMPIVEPFYAMTKKGFDLGAIAQELNQKTRAWLPVERFVAATLIAVDFGNASIEVWNGGNPPCVVLDDDGRVVHSFVPRHPPLGVICVQKFDAAVEVFRFTSACQLIAYSDGAIMTSVSPHQVMGVNGVLDALTGAAPDQRLERFKALVETRHHEDDVTVMVVDCVPAHHDGLAGGAASGKHAAPRLDDCRFSITFSAKELKYLDTVSLALDFVERIDATHPHRRKLFMLLSELVTNAIDHGLLEIDPAIKREPDGFERYLTLRSESLARQSAGRLELTLELTTYDAKPVFRIVIADSGAGFDYQRVLSALTLPDHDNPYGRGIALVKALCLSLEYRGTGNQVVAIYDLGVPASAEVATAIATPCS